MVKLFVIFSRGTIIVVQASFIIIIIIIFPNASVEPCPIFISQLLFIITFDSLSYFSEHCGFFFL